MLEAMVTKLKRTGLEMVLGCLCLAVILLLCLYSFTIPYEAISDYGSTPFAPPSREHWLGTDQLGRDNFSRLAVGSRSSIWIGACSVLLSGVVGSSMGMVAAWYGGWPDLLLLRLIDTLKAVPSLLLSMMVVAVFGSSEGILIATISFITLPLYARVARGATLQVRNRDYSLWAKQIGISDGRILIRHILPNIVFSLGVTASLGFANAVMSEAALSYLGMGVRPPTPSWGRMLADAGGYLFNAPWLAIGNALALVMLVLGFNLLSEGLQKGSRYV